MRPVMTYNKFCLILCPVCDRLKNPSSPTSSLVVFLLFNILWKKGSCKALCELAPPGPGGLSPAHLGLGRFSSYTDPGGGDRSRRVITANKFNRVHHA